MKTLTLSNGKSYDFTDNSHITRLVKEVEAFSEIDEIAADMTEENLSGATFDGDPVENCIPVSCTAEQTEGTITVGFVNRFKTETEIMKDEITELQEALAEIAGA